jgi:hypothetical protein|uniref:Uncharacterized protein n=1 Tax=Podoviridae sp. ctQZJ2 TaxID=2825248 RepID=A0A8S5P4A8_9CAUD|nr:MAG TPA: hypothetical protein [Podoviridae sp. ctQZJ2]
MARKQKITRDVTSTEVEVMLCDTSTGDVRFEYDTIVGKTTEKRAKKKAKEQHEKDNVVVVKVTLTEKHDKYSMDLETFVKNAEIVDVENRKSAETENE